jgi:hypothetical protein
VKLWQGLQICDMIGLHIRGQTCVSAPFEKLGCIDERSVRRKSKKEGSFGVVPMTSGMVDARHTPGAPRRFCSSNRLFHEHLREDVLRTPSARMRQKHIWRSFVPCVIANRLWG